MTAPTGPAGTRSLEVLAPGPLTTVQDLGRPGLAAVGVGRSGAADRRSLRLANRLVGNPESAATLEVTLGGLRLRAHADLVVAVTGAPCPVTLTVRGLARGSDLNTPVRLAAGAELGLAVPATGLRTYLAVRGGLVVPPVLGSRSTDLLAGLGPDPLRPGMRLPVGPPQGPSPGVDLAPVCPPPGADISLRVLPGPRADWFTEDALATLAASRYEVTSESNRIGLRLAGPGLRRTVDRELPSEGMIPGSLQVPPSGQPTLFLADAPVTGGYPVVATVLDADVDLAAQARPGQGLRFVPVPAPPLAP